MESAEATAAKDKAKPRMSVRAATFRTLARGGWRTGSGRAAESAGSFFERQALEVMQHNRSAKRPGQAVDFAIQGLGLLAGDERAFGRLNRRLNRSSGKRT